MTMTTEQRREQCRLAGKARAAAFTPAYQRAARAAQPPEMCAAKGRKAFAAMVAQHGLDGAMAHLADYRRAHPSRLERQVMAWLDQHYIAYEREVCIAGAWVDFLISGTRTVIEVDGRMAHELHPLHGQDRAGRDTIHGMALATAGYTLIRLPESGIRAGSAWALLEGI